MLIISKFRVRNRRQHDLRSGVNCERRRRRIDFKVRSVGARDIDANLVSLQEDIRGDVHEEVDGRLLAWLEVRAADAVDDVERLPVGIDVEQIERPIEGKESRVERVRSRFMGNKEHADTTVGLLLHWSAKETVYKVMGRETVDFMTDLCIEPFDEQEYESEMTLRDSFGHTHTVNYKVFDEFVLTYTNFRQ